MSGTWQVDVGGKAGHLKLLHSLSENQHYVSQIPRDMEGRYVTLKGNDGTHLRGKYESAAPSATEGLTVLTLSVVGQRVRFALRHHAVINFDPQEAP